MVYNALLSQAYNKNRFHNLLVLQTTQSPHQDHNQYPRPSHRAHSQCKVSIVTYELFSTKPNVLTTSCHTLSVLTDEATVSVMSSPMSRCAVFTSAELAQSISAPCANTAPTDITQAARNYGNGSLTPHYHVPGRYTVCILGSQATWCNAR